MEKKYTIYKATNKINGKVYIGKTSDFETRKWQHERCYEKEDCVFHRALLKYGKENFSWEIIDGSDKDYEASQKEKYWIKFYNSCIHFENSNGYNMNCGGTGGHNANPVVMLELNGTFIKRYDSAAQAQAEDGFCNSDVLLSCKNKKRTSRNHIFMFEDEYIKNGGRVYEKPLNESRKTIIQCDLDGNFIHKFDSVSEASQKTGILRSRISGAITGANKTAGGFIFIYEKDFPIKDIEKYKIKKKGRPIIQINPHTGQIVDRFERIADAGRKLGVNYKAIHKVVDLPDRTAYGFAWRSI